MLLHYLRIAIRNLSRNKTYVAINIAGLTFALGCSILAYVNYDYRNRFDETHSNTQDVYRINSLRKKDKGTEPWATTPVALGKFILNDLENYATVARLGSTSAIVKSADKVFHEKVYFADEAMFDFFNLTLKKGSPKLLANKSQLIISEAIAKKYFGTESPIGKPFTLLRDSIEENYIIGGILESISRNSSFQWDIVAPFDNYADNRTQLMWANQNHITTFIKIQENNKHVLLTQLKKYAQWVNSNQQNMIVEEFYLQSFHSIAFSSDVDMPDYVYGSPLNSNPRGVVMIGPIILALLLLLIASFNYTNTSMVMASNRLKEIGVRKVLGGKQLQLIGQFMAENFVLSAFSLLLGLTFSALLLPVLNEVLLTELKLDFFTNGNLMLFLLGTILFTTALSGLYPAYFISSFKPTGLLKGKAKLTSGSLHRVLLTLQFAICSFALIVGIIMTQNSSFQQESDMGYDMDMVDVVSIDNEGEYKMLQDACEQYPTILGFSGTQDQLGAGDSHQVKIIQDGLEATVYQLRIGAKYLETVGIELAEGRTFESLNTSDVENALIVNQAFVKELGLTSPIEKPVTLEQKNYYIIGVVEDYKEFGNHGKIPAMIFRLTTPQNYRYANVRSQKEDKENVRAQLMSVWKKGVPDKPYEGFYQNEMMEKEIRLSNGFKVISFSIAMLVMLLSAGGLYSLVSLSILKRMKEIGIRKIHGANTLQIASLINKEFATILLMAFVAGSALAFVVVSKLIFTFIYAYHSYLSLMPFLVSFAGMICCTLLIVGGKIYKAANTNPVDILKE